MLELIKKIGQGCLVLVMLLALVGVNVKQLYCCHAEHVRWEVCLLPSDVVSVPCEDGCCGEQSCHHTTRSDFYKVTDCSQIESEPDLSLLPIDLPEEWMSEFLVEKLIISEYRFLKNKWPDRVLQRPLLCTYLC